MTTCEYVSPNGNKCSHTPFRQDGDSQLCIFHMPVSAAGKAQKFQESFLSLLNSGNGNMQGFIFPSDFKLERKKFSFPIDLSYSTFSNVSIQGTTFESHFLARHIQVQGHCLVESSFFKSICDFMESEFHGRVIISSSFLETGSFTQCQFLDRVQVRGVFKKQANFNHCNFADSVLFQGNRVTNVSVRESAKLSITTHAAMVLTSNSGRVHDHEVLLNWANSVCSNFKDIMCQTFDWFLEKLTHTCSNYTAKLKYHLFGINVDFGTKQNRLFENDFNLEFVSFQRPERVNFTHVDFRRARVAGTNLIGTQFSDVNWKQDKLKRNGLYEEAILDKAGLSQYAYMIQRLEEAYRNVRVALENNKDFNTASDFYIGERDCHRKKYTFFKRHFFCVDAWYNALSRYGTKPTQALSIIVQTFILYVGLRFLISGVDPLVEQKVVWSYLLDVLKIFTLQKVDATSQLVNYLNIFYRLVEPVMLTLTALSFRARIKRH